MEDFTDLLFQPLRHFGSNFVDFLPNLLAMLIIFAGGLLLARVVQVTFLIGGLMAGAAAFLYMMRIEATKFDVGFILGVKAFTAAVLGGIGNLRGALLGGLVLGLAENYGSAFFGTEWKDVIAFVLLVMILMFRPTGLLGESLGKARA